MSTEVDPTQQGGTEQPSPTANPRNAFEAQIAAQVHAQTSEDLASFDEESGQVDAKPEPEAVQTDAAVQEVQTEQQADKPVEKPRMLTIIVDGQAIEVEESKAIEAGKRTLQKDNAADRRLQEAARKLQEADAAQRRAEAQAQYIRQVAEQHGIQLQAPSQDAPQQSQQATQAIDPAALGAIIEDRIYHREAQRAATKFWSDFPDIAGDPYLRQMAANLEQQRIDAASTVGEPLGDPYEAYRKHGETVRTWLKQRTGQTTPTAAAITDKSERKRSITAIPAANARAQAPEEKRPPTASEIIEAERISRSQGRRGYQRLN